MSPVFKYTLFLILLPFLPAVAQDISYVNCSQNPFIAIAAARSETFHPSCLTEAMKQALLVMDWEKLMRLRAQYYQLLMSQKTYNNTHEALINQQLSQVGQEISKLSWIVNKIPNSQFVQYFHPLDMDLKQQIINLWNARLRTQVLTSGVLQYAEEVETTISLKYNIYISKATPQNMDHQRYSFTNCANDILLAFTAAVKAQDHPKCVEAALLRLKNRTMLHDPHPLPYFDALPAHLQNRIEGFLKHRYYFKSVPPNLGLQALAKNKASFGQNGFWFLGHEAVSLQNELEQTGSYQLWLNSKLPT